MIKLFNSFKVIKEEIMNGNGRYNSFLLDPIHYVMTIDQLHFVFHEVRGCQYINFDYILMHIKV